jgi:ectoine hydrolase
MAKAGTELLVISDPSNMAWLTSYDGWSFYVYQCVLVPPEGEPVWFGRRMDAGGAKRTAWLATTLMYTTEHRLAADAPIS